MSEANPLERALDTLLDKHFWSEWKEVETEDDKDEIISMRFAKQEYRVCKVCGKTETRLK